LQALALINDYDEDKDQLKEKQEEEKKEIHRREETTNQVF
jgi:hypothetical protein